MAQLAIIGAEIGNAIGIPSWANALLFGGFAFLLNKPHQQVPTFRSMSSAWGLTWPLCYNSNRIGGNVLQASDVKKGGGKKGKKGAAKFSQTFAIGFCEGPRSIGRIWADQQVIYDPRPITDPPIWQANTVYGAGDTIVPTAGSANRWFIATVNGTSGSTEPTWNTAVNAITRDGEQVWNTELEPKNRKVGKQFKFTMRIYNGSETQLQDSALEEIVGAGAQSAYRGLVYIVFENFDLSKFGNRIPNIEAETFTFLVPTPFNPDIPDGYIGFGDLWIDPTGVVAYAWGNKDTVGPDVVHSVLKVDMTSPAVLQSGPPIADLGYQHASKPNAAPNGSWTGNDLWWSGRDPVGGGNAMVSVDKDTLAISHMWPVGTPILPIQSIIIPPSLNSDGSILAGLFYVGSYPSGSQWIFLMNTSDGTALSYDVSAIGGPANEGAGLLFTPTFDNNNKLWFYDDQGRFWRFTVTPGSPPVASAAVSFTGRPNDGAQFGTLDFNPVTGIATAWSLNASSNDVWVIPINTNTDIVGTINTATNAGDSLYGGSVDMFNWNTKRYVALGGNHTDIIGRYDRLTGTTIYYDYLATWNVSTPLTPNGQSLRVTSIGISQSGQNMVATQYNHIPTPPGPGNDFWFFPLSPSQLTLADIAADISDRVGLAGKYDYSGLAPTIPRGVKMVDRQPARQFIESLMPAYFFDITDIGDALVGTLRSTSSLLLTVPEADLAAGTNPSQIVDKLSIDRAQDLEIARDLAISFFDYEHDYLPGTTAEVRNPITTYSSGRNTLTVPCVLTPQEAANMAQRVIYLMWIERNIYRLSLPLEYLKLTPADSFEAVRNGQNHVIRATRVTLNPTLDITIEAVSEDFGVYSLTAPATIADLITGSFAPGSVIPIVTPLLAVLDTATLQQADLQNPGVYVAGSTSIAGEGWDSESVQESTDDSTFTEVTTLPAESIIATVGTTLADWPRFTAWDRTNTLTVTVLFGQLASAAEDLLISDFTNLAWLSNGEIIQFATATPSGSDWILSDLLRGRFGTEAFTGTHGSGETMVLLDPSTIRIVNYSPSELDAVRYWKGVNDADVNPETPVQTLTMTTRRLMPYAPYHLRGARDGPKNLTITGLRRMRWRGTPLWRPPETDLPVTIQVDIMNGASVVRTITSVASGGGSSVTDASAFSVYYSAADQTTDFGSTQASVSVKVYQLNAVRGRGYPGKATV